jgi:hypothetical protein
MCCISNKHVTRTYTSVFSDAFSPYCKFGYFLKLITAKSTVLLYILITTEMLQKFPTLYGAQIFVTVFITASNCTLYCTN